MTSPTARGDEPTAAAELVARESYGRLLALLASGSRDIPAAEDALADAFERALRAWPAGGIPTNPTGWIFTVARNRLRDRFRSADHRRADGGRGYGPRELVMDDSIDLDAIGDKRLELMFVCAHPAIDPAVRAPLMLQTVLGFDATQIAKIFVVPAPAMAQRLVRAKRRIKDAGIAFVIPDRSLMPSRLPAVLEAVYGTYAIDWQLVAGVTARESAAGEALFLATLLADLLPGEPECLGLAALICFSMSRSRARLDADGMLVPLDAQDPREWDAQLIDRGEALLARAHAAGRSTAAAFGRFQLEAAIQSVHAARRRSGQVDWDALRRLHEALAASAPSLGVLVSLAAVIGHTDPSVGLNTLDELGERIARFQPAWATRAALAAATGDVATATAAYAKAISLTTDGPSRRFLERELRTLGERG